MIEGIVALYIVGFAIYGQYVFLEKIFPWLQVIMWWAEDEKLGK